MNRTVVLWHSGWVLPYKAPQLLQIFTFLFLSLLCASLLLVVEQNRQTEFSPKDPINICYFLSLLLFTFTFYFHFYFLVRIFVACCWTLDRQSSLRRIPLRFDHPLSCTSTGYETNQLRSPKADFHQQHLLIFLGAFPSNWWLEVGRILLRGEGAVQLMSRESPPQDLVWHLCNSAVVGFVKISKTYSCLETPFAHTFL